MSANQPFIPAVHSSSNSKTPTSKLNKRQVVEGIYENWNLSMEVERVTTH